MKTYFFALGMNHTLSKIDIVNLLVRKGLDFEIIEASEEVLIISIAVELGAKTLVEELGSAAKIGEIFKVYQKSEWPDEFLKEIERDSSLSASLKLRMTGTKQFGISVYGAGGKFKELNEVFYSRSKVADKLRDLARLDFDSRSEARRGEIREQGRVLSTVAVDKNELLPVSPQGGRGRGFELVLCVGGKGIYVGKTLAIQDYESYSFRDYGRPRRNAKSGMIPPKLAKMMINLAGKEKNNVFLDPFCGDGTILQEQILLGYRNVIGSDVEDKAIENSRINLDWLLASYHLRKEDYKIELFLSEVSELSKKVLPWLIDAVITEPFLGSPEARFFRPDQIKKEIAKLESLYLSAFAEFKKILKENGIVVIVFPVFRFKSQFFHLQIMDEIARLGFKTRDFLKKEVKGADLLKLQITDRNSVIFFRPGQTISREIFFFRR